MADTSGHQNPSSHIVSEAKKPIARAAGALVYRLMPAYRNRLLNKWPQHTEALSGIQLLVFRVLMERVMSEYYRPSTSTSRREELKDSCMGGDAGVVWAEHYASRSFTSLAVENNPMFRVLEQVLAQGGTKAVHQVACSSGREVAYFAQRYPEIKFVGSDMDDAVVVACRERWQDLPNLSFTLVRLERLNADEQRSLQSDLVYASGGLQYLDETSLRRFLSTVRQSTTRFLLRQPLGIEFLMEENTHSNKRANFSWNHPYTHYLRESGWSDVNYDVSDISDGSTAQSVSVWAQSEQISGISQSE